MTAANVHRKAMAVEATVTPRAVPEFQTQT